MSPPFACTESTGSADRYMHARVPSVPSDATVNPFQLSLALSHSKGHTSMAQRAHRQRSPGPSRAAAAALAPPSPPERRSLPPLRSPAVTHAAVVSESVVGQILYGAGGQCGSSAPTHTQCTSATEAAQNRAYCAEKAGHAQAHLRWSRALPELVVADACRCATPTTPEVTDSKRSLISVSHRHQP